MIDPFATLGVPTDADDAQVRRAYIDRIRRYPADRFPERFQRIRKAYEQIETRRERLRYRLFSTEPPSPQNLLDQLDALAEPRRPDLSQFQALLRLSRDQSG